MSLRTRPWNRVPQAVYSLSTTVDGEVNMNICTYVTPITMAPKQLIVGVYHGTKTWENFKQTGEGLLQILGEHQPHLIRALGKKSGNTYNKHRYLQKSVAYQKDLAYLSDCLGYIHLRVKTWIPESDHDLVICEVISWKNLREGTPLTTTYLKEHTIIR